MKNLIYLSLFLLLSCNNQTSTMDTSIDPYIQNLKEQFPKIYSRQSTYLQIEGMYQPNGLVSTKNCQRLIVSDYAEKKLFLLNPAGKVIHQTGGEGRGPEEFQSILNPNIGSDDRLYVLDPLLFRINIYEITDGHLKFIESVSYKNPENHFLTAVYVTEYGHFGLFQDSPNGFFSPENRYFLYRLDEHFATQEQLFEMPGRERLKFETPAATLFTPHQYARGIHWSLDEEWFYNVTTDDETIHRYNLQTGKMESLTFFDLEERQKNTHFIEAVEEHHPDADDEVFMEKLKVIESLPLFSSFYVENQKVFLNVLAAPGEGQIILYIDLQSNEVQHFEASYGFTPQSLCDNHINGIDYRIDGEVRLMEIAIPFQK
jgi:hypothetical protein